MSKSKQTSSKVSTIASRILCGGSGVFVLGVPAQSKEGRHGESCDDQG